MLPVFVNPLGLMRMSGELVVVPFSNDNSAFRLVGDRLEDLVEDDEVDGAGIEKPTIDEVGS